MAAGPTAGGKKYERLASDLRQRISGGEFAVGTFLPSEAVLADDYEVSRWVVREALDQLAEGGWIYKRSGLGSEVIRSGDREAVHIGPGALITAVIPNAEQRSQANAGQGEPVLIVVVRTGEPPVMYPADTTVLVVTA
jgi:DNA-binding GntR family transcriptional regulator